MWAHRPLGSIRARKASCGRHRFAPNFTRISGTTNEPSTLLAIRRRGESPQGGQTSRGFTQHLHLNTWLRNPVILQNLFRFKRILVGHCWKSWIQNRLSIDMRNSLLTIEPNRGTRRRTKPIDSTKYNRKSHCWLNISISLIERVLSAMACSRQLSLLISGTPVRGHSHERQS